VTETVGSESSFSSTSAFDVFITYIHPAYELRGAMPDLDTAPFLV